ncbi:unnamed protein product [Protopolystoma xenopodis]|uniref:Uncharacterized protein n=1 Tax=Protopolystoma xenopodis TaxID=117903 RepID=A0A448XPK2_9PLAT|nr:unnamed protein product [Protopolystoma xenopodis]
MQACRQSDLQKKLHLSGNREPRDPLQRHTQDAKVALKLVRSRHLVTAATNTKGQFGERLNRNLLEDNQCNRAKMSLIIRLRSKMYCTSTEIKAHCE